MAVGHLKHAVGVFPNRVQAEQALSQLRDSGFPMQQVSAIAKDAASNDQLSNTSQTGNQAGEGARAGAIAGGATRAEDRGDNESQEGAGIGAVTGTALGGIGGLLVGLEALIIPGAGPFLAAGTVATTLAGAGIGAAAGAIVGALTGLGIPEEDAKAYSQQVSQGDYLVMLEGTDEEINRAGSILRDRGIHDWNVYTMSGDRYDSGVATTDVNRETQRYAEPTDRDVVDTTNTSNSDADVVIVDRREEIR